MKVYDVEVLFIPNFEWEKKQNIRYLSGFTGSSALCVLTCDQQIFVTDGRYRIQAFQEVKGWDVHIIPSEKTYIDVALEKIAVENNAIVGLMEDEVLWSFSRMLTVKKPSWRIIPLSNIVRKIRAVKDETEIEAIQQAIYCMEEALQLVYKRIRPGISDCELVTHLRRTLIEMGMELAFPPIIVSGHHSAIVHGNPFQLPQKCVGRGDIIQFDVGCIFDGYVCDISRVVICGKATQKQKRMHGAIVHTLEQSYDMYRAGSPLIKAAWCANQALHSHRYPKLPHGLGHGIGLEVHELPVVSANSNPEEQFEVGHVVTNEPGIYIEGYGGMRIERDVLVTKNGPIFLDTLTTDLIEL